MNIRSSAFASVAIALCPLFANNATAQATSQAAAASAPDGATGLCNNGTYTYSSERKGSCHGRQGIQQWFGPRPDRPAANAAQQSQTAESSSRATEAVAASEEKVKSPQTQERKFLGKSEVEELANGKKWVHVRTADQNNVRWDLRSGGSLFANNYTTSSSDAGIWTVNDKGQLCVKWRGRSQDRCVSVASEGGKLKLIDSADLNIVYAELNVE